MPHFFAHIHKRITANLRYRLRKLSAQQPALLYKPTTPTDGNFKYISFTFAVIALSARVACADGKLTREKYLAFRDSFPLTGGECTKIRSLFTLACHNPLPVEHYTMQIKHLFPKHSDLFASLMERLFRIAIADGKMTRASERVLSHIAHMLELSPTEYMAIRLHYERPLKAHQILGLGKRADAVSLKKRYRELMRRYHPDRFATQDLSPEMSLLLSLKTSEISQAYQHLSKKAA